MSVIIKNLTKKFRDRVIFQNLNFTFEDTGFYALVGPSGSGKSTLLEIIAGIDVDFKGALKINKTNIKTKLSEERSDLRLKKMGYLRQGYDLLELENALDNITLPLKAVSNEKVCVQNKRSKDISKHYDVDDKMGETVNRLSGGEKQRVAFVRAIVNSPIVLLCDEPTGSLDSKSAVCIYEKLREVSKKTLVIMVTHDENAAFYYADCVLRIENMSSKVEKNSQSDSLSTGTFKMRKRNKIKRIPIISWLKHAYHLCKERKKRTFLSLSVLSFSFISLGLASYLSSDISKEIDRSFSSILGSGSLVMERRGAGDEVIGNTITASETDVVHIVENNPEVEDYGTFYFADFDSYFKDLDIAYIENGANKITLKGLSIRSVNEFLWMNENDNDCYPETPKILEDDQIVLGLPYADMFQLCFQLHILRDYEHLGDYIADNGLNVVFSVSNSDWNYDDEQIVSIKAVKPSNVMTIYSYNHKWSEHIYEERMRFPTSDTDDYSLPWIMKKAFYIKPSNTGSEMMRQLRENPDYERYIFEPDSYAYDQSHCKIGYLCSTKRYYVFLADKSSVSISDVNDVKKESGLNSFIIGTNYTYASYPKNLMTGFVFPFYASNDKETADMMLDKATSLGNEPGVSEILPDNVSKGSYVLPASSALTLSNDFSKLVSGRKPDFSYEVAISSALNKKWGNPKTIHLVGLINQEQIGSTINNEYRSAEVKVVGVVEDTWEKLFVDSFWAIDFFRDELGMSSFLLEPTKCIFEYGDEVKEDIKNDLTERFLAYEFTDPSEQISKSSEQVFSYLKTSLSLASVSSFLLAFILLFVTVILTILENKKEGSILYCLGFRRKEIERSLNSINVLLTVPSILSAALFISIMEIFLHRQIGSNFGVETEFVFSFEPILVILISGIIAFLFIRLYIHRYVAKRDFLNEMKYR